MTEFASLPPVTSDGLEPTVTAVAKAVADRADELGDALEEAVIRKSGLSKVAALVLPHDDVRDAMCRANIRSILAAMVDETQFDSALATKIGVERARNITALSSLLASDRIGFRRLWDIVANAAARHASINGEALRSLTARLHTAEDLYMHAMVTGYRDERRRQVLGETPRRTVLIDSLLHGRILDDWSLWEVANRLRLPSQGPYVVIAAELPAVGTEALPDIESKLASLDVYSAWRLLPDVQIGIAHVKSDHRFDEVVALVCRMASNRVGVSARFDDLRDTAYALHCAKVTLRGRGDRVSRGLGVRRLHPGHRRCQRPRDHGQIRRQPVGRFPRSSGRGARDPLRHVSGVAGQRLRARHCATTCCSSQHRATPTPPNREVHRPVAFAAT